jgi:hypothetical protein
MVYDALKPAPVSGRFSDGSSSDVSVEELSAIFRANR